MDFKQLLWQYTQTAPVLNPAVFPTACATELLITSHAGQLLSSSFEVRYTKIVGVRAYIFGWYTWWPIDPLQM